MNSGNTLRSQCRSPGAAVIDSTVMHKKASHCSMPLLVLAGLTVVVASGCRQTPSYQSFGAQIIEVDHGSQQAASAVYATHREMNGSPFSDRGRTWTSIGGDLDSAVAETTFRLPGGAQCVVTRITVKGRPLLVLLNSTDDRSCMQLHNVFTSNLVKQGVKPRKRWQNQLGAANRSQPVGQQTNGTSTAAGPGR